MPAMPLTPCWPPPVITSISCLDGWSSFCLDSWRLKLPRPPFNGRENRKLHGRPLRALRAPPRCDPPPTYAAPLGLLGGFLDAIGGGGWGAIVTSTLLGSGHSPRKSHWLRKYC